MESNLRVAVIGCGNISKVHLQALSALEGVTVCAVCDIDHDRAARAAEAHACPAYTDWKTMLDAERPDAVHLCTPHDLHVPMAVEALGRGIHVLCEKPCAITRSSLRTLQAAAKSSKAQYGVCFQNRYNPGVVQAKALLRDETYGRLIAEKGDVSWCRGAGYYSDGWHGTKDREGGGVLINQAIHTLDLLGYLANAKSAAVSARLFNDHLQGVIDVEDTADVRLTYDTGVAAYLHATTAFALNARVMIDLFCEKATLRLEGADLYVLLPGGDVQRLTEPTDKKAVGQSYWGHGHAALIADFYRCVRTGAAFSIDAFEGAKAVEALLEAYQFSG
ncbi:MAG: Gfo/Idh/MocA family oxidoreductase [Clostridia bacterium]|nr:Gfo/Idh/MocA family oxidoreductase [Clostridia bacterium]